MGVSIKSRKFALPSIILLGINSILGTGIFLLPGKAMELVGPSSIFIYLFVTLIVIAIAFCFAECASYFERNGGSYLYAKEAFGDFIGFEIGIMKWAVSIIAWATMAVAFLTALEQVVPAIGTNFMRPLLLTSFIGGLGLINIRGIRNIRFLSNVFSLGKLVPIALFLFFGMFFIESDNFYPMIPSETEYTAFGAAGLLIFFAFSGFEGLAVAAEEMENPKRNLPLAIFAVIAITATLYLLTQFIVVGILGPALNGSNVPIALAAEKIGGSYGLWLVMICLLISCIGTNLAASFIAPRSGMALAQDGLISKKVAKPAVAIMITTVLTIAVALTGSFAKLATISVIARFVQYFSTCLAVLFLRRYRPDLVTTFPRVLGPAIPCIGLFFILLLLGCASMEEILFGLAGLAVGVPLFFIQKSLQEKKKN